jgi:hypothetical protein
MARQPFPRLADETLSVKFRSGLGDISQIRRRDHPHMPFLPGTDGALNSNDD